VTPWFTFEYAMRIGTAPSCAEVIPREAGQRAAGLTIRDLRQRELRLR